MKHYTAIATREGKWWQIRIPKLNGLTQARRLADVELMAREYIAVTLDVPIDTISVDVGEAVPGVNISAMLTQIQSDRTEAAALESAASARAVELAKALAGADVPVRDIGTVMGVSFQRVHQLLNQ